MTLLNELATMAVKIAMTVAPTVARRPMRR
jgi:hypothetical protein